RRRAESPHPLPLSHKGRGELTSRISAVTGGLASPPEKRCEMDFRFTAEDEAFREEIREFLREELPNAGSRDSDGWRGHRAFIKKLAERGWLTLAWAVEGGGSGAYFLRQLGFNAEMGVWEGAGEG